MGPLLAAVPISKLFDMYKPGNAGPGGSIRIYADFEKFEEDKNWDTHPGDTLRSELSLSPHMTEACEHQLHHAPSVQVICQLWQRNLAETVLGAVRQPTMMVRPQSSL